MNLSEMNPIQLACFCASIPYGADLHRIAEAVMELDRQPEIGTGKQLNGIHMTDWQAVICKAQLTALMIEGLNR